MNLGLNLSLDTLGLGGSLAGGGGGGGGSAYFFSTASTVAYRSDQFEGTSASLTRLNDTVGTNHAPIDTGSTILSTTLSLNGNAPVKFNSVGFDLTTPIPITGAFDLFVVWYMRSVGLNRVFCTDASNTYLFAREGFYRFALNGSVYTLWNSPPSNLNIAIRLYRDSSNNMKIFQNGTDVTPGAKSSTATGTMTRLAPYGLSGYDACKIYETSLLVGSTYTSAQVTKAWSYLDSRYASLSISVP